MSYASDDGYEATKIIRKIQSDLSNYVSIYAMTASDLEEDKQAYIDFRMDGVFAKPIQKENMQSILANIFDRGN